MSRSIPSFPFAILPNRAVCLSLLLILVAPLGASAQAPCAHDGDCAGGEICAAGVGARLGLAADDVCLAPRSLAPRTYDVVEFNNLTTPSGALFRHIIARDLNHRGQVVGQASGDIEPVDAAFRFTPGVGLEILAPPQSRGAAALLINDQGDVLGEEFNPRRLFILRADGSVERLDRGSNAALRTAFQAIHFNNRGDVSGIFHKRDGRWVPYRYTARQGWVNLWGPFAPLRGKSLIPIGMNESGDIPFLGVDGSGGGFLIRGENHVQVLGDLLPFSINERGQIAGTERGERIKPFLFDPKRGRTSLDRGQFTGGLGLAVSENGVVVGAFARQPTASRPSTPDTLFTFDERRPQRLKVVARANEFEAALPPDRDLSEIHQVEINQQGEMVGSVLHVAAGDPPDAEHEVGYFYFHRSVGVLTLEQMVRNAGVPGNLIVWSARFNERGQILLTLLRRTDGGFSLFTGSALLTPVE